MNKLIAIIFVTVTFILPYHVLAAGFDGSEPILCAMTEAFECSIENGCNKGTLESMNIPRFIKIDVRNKKITTAEGRAEKRESEIRNFKRDNGVMIFQGMEGGRGWNIIVAEDTGKMSGTASEDEGGFVVFGACIPN